MDLAFKNATERREQLAREINELEQRSEVARKEIASVDRFLEEWRRYAGVSDRNENTHDSGDGKPHDATETQKPKKERPQNPSKESIGDVLEQYFIESGKPASRQRLFSALEDSNIHLQGTDPQMVLSTMLWRMPTRFVRLKGFGYWLANEPYEPAKYSPNLGDKFIKGMTEFSEVTREDIDMPNEMVAEDALL